MITVKISFVEMSRLGHPYPDLLRIVCVLKALRDGGIPVVGVLSIEGVEHGKLTIYKDDVFEDHVYEWVPGIDPFAL